MNWRQIISAFTLVLLIAATAAAADYTIKAGSTNQSVYFVLKKEAFAEEVQPRMATGITHSTTGIKAAYVRAGAAAQPITLVSQSASGTYTS
jgi:hypothetical protein